MQAKTRRRVPLRPWQHSASWQRCAEMLRGCPAVAAAFLEPEKYQNAVIPIYDELLTPNHMVKTFTRVTGIKARCEPCAGAAYLRTDRSVRLC